MVLTRKRKFFLKTSDGNTTILMEEAVHMEKLKITVGGILAALLIIRMFHFFSLSSILFFVCAFF